MTNYKTPGVYVEEIRKLPPSIASVETAIPVFIGYTEKAENKEVDDLLNIPKKIASLFDYERFFGGPEAETSIEVHINQVGGSSKIFAKISPTDRSKHILYYNLQFYFSNGGGECWIVSVGNYLTPDINDVLLTNGLAEIEKIDEITLILFPEAQGLPSASGYYTLYEKAMNLCAKLGDRFTIMDLWQEDDRTESVDTLRSKGPVNIDIRKYGAAYYPNLETSIDYYYGGEGPGDLNVKVLRDGIDEGTLDALKSIDNALYFQARSAIRELSNILPASSAIAGVYSRVDDSRGVWKAPANVNMINVISPVVKITTNEQENLNVDSNSGKSINVIRSFAGRGPAIVWGARTLAGNDNEWRYISVRRFFNMVEKSVKNATVQFVFEPNDVNSWKRVKSMIENYLIQQWKAGALMGTTPEEAYYVKVGLNETMSELDIWEGRMIVEIGMAVVRPAEFIILKFSHKMLSES